MSDYTVNRGGRPATHGSRQLDRLYAQGQLSDTGDIADALAEIRNELAADRGGWSHVSAGDKLLIERCAAATIILRLIEWWVYRQPGIIIEGQDGARLIGPLAKGYTSHLAALTRALSALGIHPDKVKGLPDLNLDAYQAGYDAGVRAAENGRHGAAEQAQLEDGSENGAADGRARLEGGAADRGGTHLSTAASPPQNEGE
jgi:hypothetical protein